MTVFVYKILNKKFDHYKIYLYVFIMIFYIWNYKDWNCIGPKTGLGSNANGPNNKFVERGQKN